MNVLLIDWAAADPRSNHKLDRHEIRHGTRTRYHNGCRCEPCREAERVYRQTYRDKRRQDRQRPETLAVNCWCDRDVVRVTKDALRAGMTGSCGRPMCSQRRVKPPPSPDSRP